MLHDADSRSVNQSHAKATWQGQDYYNPRIKDVKEGRLQKDLLQRVDQPRLPWQDIACELLGRPARDVARHCVERWNHARHVLSGEAHGIEVVHSFSIFSPEQQAFILTLQLPTFDGGDSFSQVTSLYQSSTYLHLCPHRIS
jgi:phosphatidylserine/phosphatidylglycerophosphate/cardiolipin synthase-like enzyme